MNQSYPIPNETSSRRQQASAPPDISNVPLSPVESSTGRLASLVNSVECKVHHLKDRLKSVMALPGPNAPGRPEENKPACPLCVDIDGQSDKLQRVLDELHDIEERLGV